MLRGKHAGRRPEVYGERCSMRAANDMFAEEVDDK